jgi:hypothetical protein
MSQGESIHVTSYERIDNPPALAELETTNIWACANIMLPEKNGPPHRFQETAEETSWFLGAIQIHSTFDTNPQTTLSQKYPLSIHPNAES